MDRKAFQEILESIKIPEGIATEDLQRLILPLNTALMRMAPERLFKYRSCCDNHIAAFKRDEVWMSTSDLFNDPFDTLIQFEVNELRSACNAMSNPEIFKTMTHYLAGGGQIAPQIAHIVGEDAMREIRVMATDNQANGTTMQVSLEQMNTLKIIVEFYIAILPQVVQRLSTVVCFSERVDSILMWSHYADNHQGFVLGYDLRPYLLPNANNFGLFPVVYGEKRYDASEFLYWLLSSLLKMPAHNQDMMSSIKMLLYKSTEWAYEKEWRLINSAQKDLFAGRNEPVIIKPNSIYYGCRIPQDKYMILHETAMGKGLEEHHMGIDNASNSYKMVVGD